MSDITLLQLQVVDFFNPDKPTLLDYFFIFMSFFGSWKVLAGLTGAAFLADRELGKKLILLFIITGALLFPLKTFIHEERPPLVSEDIRAVGGVEPTNSFPSGHSTFAFAYASVLSSLYGRGRYLYSLALIVALSRLYLGQHYPGDVVFGAALGVTSGYLTNYLYVKKEVIPWKP